MRWTRTLLGMVLLLAVQVGQFALVLHQQDLDAHKDGHACEVCLHASPLDHVAGGTIAALPVVPAPELLPVQPAPTLISAAPLAPRVRGPPPALSA